MASTASSEPLFGIVDPAFVYAGEVRVELATGRRADRNDDDA
jgi:hypothetical protein